MKNENIQKLKEIAIHSAKLKLEDIEIFIEQLKQGVNHPDQLSCIAVECLHHYLSEHLRDLAKERYKEETGKEYPE